MAHLHSEAGHPTPIMSWHASTTPTWFAAGPESTVGCPAKEQTPAWESPRHIDSYLLLERIGRGGEAIIWRALRTDPEPRVVALKLFEACHGLAPHDPMVQLLYDAARGGRLADTAIVPLYDYGEVHGHAYLVMPLIDGPTLDSVLRQRRDYLDGQLAVGEVHPLALLPDAEFLTSVVRLLVRIARGVEALHNVDMVHRDIKPGNILLGQDGRSWLTDFGLAGRLGDLPPGYPDFVDGTPTFLAPEKLLGWEVIDEVQCDLYALGATLYQAVTLATAPRLSRQRLHSQGAAPRLRTGPSRPRSPRPGTPATLEAVILRAMAKDPGWRYMSARELADDLEESLAQLEGAGLR